MSYRVTHPAEYSPTDFAGYLNRERGATIENAIFDILNSDLEAQGGNKAKEITSRLSDQKSFLFCIPKPLSQITTVI